MDLAMEQDELGDDEHSPEPMSDDADPEGKFTNLYLKKRTTWMMMHSSSQKNSWNKRTSTEGLFPPRGVIRSRNKGLRPHKIHS